LYICRVETADSNDVCQNLETKIYNMETIITDAYNSDRDLLSRFEDGSAAEEYYQETYGGKDE